MNLNGKVVLITGAGRGAGKMAAEALARQGAVIAANDLTPINLGPVVSGINAAGGTARAYLHDIAKKVDVQVMVNRVVEDFGRIDLLINSANVQPTTPLLEIDEWDLHRIFEVNLIGTILMMQSVGRVMRSQGSGIIINLVKAPAAAPAYFSASRTGLAAMTDAINREFNPLGVRVFSVAEEDPVPKIIALCTSAWDSK